MRSMKQVFIKDQTDKFGRGAISRRQFITNMMAAGVVLPTALSMATDVQAMTPKKGGVLRHATGYGGTTDSINPALASNGFTQYTIYTRGNHLTEIGQDGKLRGELAESFEASDDATTWVFDLRQGVTFHNGKTLTADDVIASFNIHRGEDTTSAAKGLVTAVTDIRKDGDNRVIFEMSPGNADFAYIVSDYHFMIMSSDGEGNVDVEATDNSTGGYTVDTFEAGLRADFTNNPNYWKEGAAHFDAVNLLSVVDPTARQSAMLNGDVDVADAIDPKTVALLGRVPNIDILETTGTQHYTFPMRLDVEPFGNADLRMALKLAIDRQELVDKILLGHGVVGNDIPVNGVMPFFNEAIPQRTFDPEKAAEHYKKSGHSGPIQLSVADAAFAGAVDAGQLIAASAKKAGIEIELGREPNDGYWSNVWMKKPFVGGYWGGRPTEDWMFSQVYSSGADWNESYWENRSFNKLLVWARSELDPVKRREMYVEMQHICHDDCGSIIPMFMAYTHAISNKIGLPGTIASNWELDGHKNGERWWIA